MGRGGRMSTYSTSSSIYGIYKIIYHFSDVDQYSKRCSIKIVAIGDITKSIYQSDYMYDDYYSAQTDAENIIKNDFKINPMDSVDYTDLYFKLKKIQENFNLETLTDVQRKTIIDLFKKKV